MTSGAGSVLSAGEASTGFTALGSGICTCTGVLDCVIVVMFGLQEEVSH